jgi:uncharacterized protein (DUF1697 family)
VTTYVALLRGVNMGGHKKVAMADLRDLLVRLGFADVRSALQSGNLVFRCRARPSRGLEKLLETALAKRLGVETDFFVRSAAEWQSVIERNPFRGEAARDPAHLVVMLLKHPPEAKKLRALRAAVAGPEAIRGGDRHLYIVYSAGFGISKLTGPVIDKHLETRCTGRNWNTVLKLGALAGG